MSTNGDRQPPNPWLVALVQSVGFLALFVVSALTLRGLASGSLDPVEAFATASNVWEQTKVLAPKVAAVAAGSVLSVLVAVLAVRHGRVMVAAAVAAWWRYRRRWESVMAALGLSKVEKGTRHAPRLRVVSVRADHDVLTVTMLPGQAPADWQHRAAELAAAFGASSARIALPHDAATADIDVILTRARGGDGGGEPLALPSGTPASIAGSMSPLAARPRPRVVALTLEILWGRSGVAGSIEPYRLMLVRFRWGVVA